ncbi:Rv2175c family DNA-binding protein [Frigoribacterium sp. RIT-PI-h]|uniref:Rv2175c family DNA-binding protein n=1 Tax=Frigoribacterium sp. RIT-PI-h TaxID=1690245 RepID=UPI0006B99C44|nr:Rv2175c family DNA-binding protein [Frigoribacterium sp. RIT-PI-h]KPG80805.1 transcriptional regulator [Frigoribacterium sp. RIT-PI-h]
MTDLSQRPWFADTEWLTVPDLVERLGLGVSRVRRLLEEHVLVGTRVDGVTKVPAVFLDGSEPRHDLRGTLTVLSDNGFDDDEAIDWMLSHDEALGTSPVAALQAGRKAEVRRVAQSLL